MMGDPSAKNPLDHLQGAMREPIEIEVRRVLSGRVSDRFDGTADQMLAMELIARGWIAYKPREDLRK